MLWYTLFVITIWISNIMAATFTETKTITVSACSAITTLSSALSSTASNLGTIVPSVLPSAISTESIIGSGILPSIILSTSSVIPSSENLAPALTFTSTVSSSSLGQSSNPTSNTVPTSILPPVETQSLSKASQGLTSTPITGVLPATEKSPTETESMKTIIQGSNTSAASLILPTPQASSGSSEGNFYATSTRSSLTSTTIVEVSSLPSSQISTRPTGSSSASHITVSLLTLSIIALNVLIFA